MRSLDHLGHEQVVLEPVRDLVHVREVFLQNDVMLNRRNDARVVARKHDKAGSQ